MPDPTSSIRDFLMLSTNEMRIVSSGDMTELQISESRQANRFFVDEETGLGFAAIPWELTTSKDRKREAGYFSRNNMMV